MFSIDVLRRAPSPCWRDQQNLEWSEQKCKLETVVWSKIEVFQNWCVKATYVYLKNRWAQVLHERVRILTWVFLLQINHRYISVCSPLINFCTSHGSLQQNGISSHLVNILSSILLLAAELSVEEPELWPLPPCLAMSGAERVLKCWKNQLHVRVFTGLFLFN